jgi:hypothetical protein
MTDDEAGGAAERRGQGLARLALSLGVVIMPAAGVGGVDAQPAEALRTQFDTAFAAGAVAQEYRPGEVLVGHGRSIERADAAGIGGPDPGKVHETSPGKVGEVSPGKVGEVSPGKVGEVSPGSIGETGSAGSTGGSDPVGA